MKAFEDALAVPSLKTQLEILESIPPKEHSDLIAAISLQQDLLEKRRSAYYQMRRLAREKQQSPIANTPEQDEEEREIKAEARFLRIAGLVAHQTRKKLPTKFEIFSDDLVLDEVFDFLARTLPAWLPDLIMQKFKGTSFYCADSASRIARRYLWSNIIPRPEPGNRYYAYVPSFILGSFGDQADKAKQLLRENTDLIEIDLPLSIRMMAEKRAYYELFTPSSRAQSASIMMMVGQLCGEGVYKLEPLLRATLEAMLECQREHEARQVIQAYDDLDPTPEQSIEFQQIGFPLFGSAHKAVVRFAIRMVDAIQDLPGFDARSFISNVAPALQLDSNPLRIELLKLIEKILERHREIRGDIAAEIAQALINPNLAVQKALLGLLKTLPASASESISDALAPYSTHVLPSLKPDFAVWVKAPPSQVIQTPIPAPAGPVVGNRLEPLASVEDLAFVANELLTDEFDPARLELFLDGLARFAAPNRSAVEKLFGSLQKRALKIDERESSSDGNHTAGLLFVVHLVLFLGKNPPQGSSWIPDPDLPDDAPKKQCGQVSYELKGPMRFAGNRLGELLKSIRDGNSSPLLATPEFELGFINADTLLERFKTRMESGLLPFHYDFIQAIARCAVDSFDANTSSLPDSHHEASRVLRFLFKGEIEGDIKTPEWWMAAARNREPFADFSDHPQLGRLDVEGDAIWARPAVYSALDEPYFDWQSWFQQPFPEKYRPTPADHLYPLQYERVLRHEMGRLGSDLKWRYSFTPGLLDGVVAHDLKYSLHIGGPSFKTADHVAGAVLSELSTRRLPLRYTMQLHMLMALTSTGLAAREAGIDLFVQASDDGRLGAALPEFGQTLSAVFCATAFDVKYHFDYSRFVLSLRQLSSYGPVLPCQLRDILIVGLEFENSPTGIPKGFPGLLELFHELLIAHPANSRIDLNEKWGGILTGKAKSLAARIAKLPLANN